MVENGQVVHRWGEVVDEGICPEVPPVCPGNGLLWGGWGLQGWRYDGSGWC
ncbi:MAG: hypothetical protein QOH84_2382 [Kribbellaceae bacterium]|nr:hypothetical protein [Kribbellaceae bacterium]